MVLPGFNTDFKYKGQVYHAQTEDNGVQNPVVVTLLYLKGAILSSKKTSYKDLLKSENFQNNLMDLMKSQHRNIMKEVLTGKYDSGPVATAATTAVSETPVEQVAPAPPSSSGPKSLDEAIMQFLDIYEAGSLPRG